MSTPWVIAVGADKIGYPLKEAIKSALEADARVVRVIDLGVTDAGDETAYGHIGIRAGEAIRRGGVNRALLCCGTGLGVAISANKVPGIRAVVAHDPYSVERSVLSNNAQVLCFGSRIIAAELARKLTQEWLRHEYDPSSPSAAKVAVIEDYELSVAEAVR